MQAVISGPLTVELVEGKTLSSQIVMLVEQKDTISLDALILLLPQFSWSQIFHGVDCLARRGGIVLHKHGYNYTLFSNQYAAQSYAPRSGSNGYLRNTYR
jgi:hypothetical protein